MANNTRFNSVGKGANIIYALNKIHLGFGPTVHHAESADIVL